LTFDIIIEIFLRSSTQISYKQSMFETMILNYNKV